MMSQGRCTVFEADRDACMRQLPRCQAGGTAATGSFNRRVSPLLRLQQGQ